ncbi:hypothetical protein DFH11DRAFT_1787198, partial [Phellopilus nigrolimitatus]
WRDIANTSPCLWTGIELNKTFSRNGTSLSPEKFLNCLGRWIKNSGDLPISIRFSYKYRYSSDSGTYEGYCNEMRNVVALLLTCQHRWHTLKITVDDLSVIQELLDTMTNLDNAPHLREFILDPDTVGDNNYPAWKDYPAWKARGTALTLHPKGRHSGYARLTGLSLHPAPSEEFILWWIKQAPNIETLDVSLRIQQPEHLQHPSPPVHKLSNLSKLCVLGLGSSDIGPLLARLNLPMLTDLELVSMGKTRLDNWTYVEDLLRHSKPQSLTNLTLTWTPISEAGILRCLEQSPGLIDLGLSLMTDMILNALTAGKGRHPYCPALESLKISDVRTNFNFGNLWDMIHSRLCDKRFKPLKKLTVSDNT